MSGPAEDRSGRPPLRCGICGATDALTYYQVREMMFGTGETFRYFQCGGCGCLQLAEIPDDLSRYYPEQYYAHAADAFRRTGLRGWLRKTRNRYVFFRRGLLGRILAAISPYPHAGVDRWLARTGVSRDSRILDVGCGTGMLLFDLGMQGFRSLTGADPFLERDVEYPGIARIRRASVQEMDGAYDLVMFHHSLEHIPHQVETLRAACRLLAPGGRCLVRVPTVSSHAWEHYREHWVQIDAPRHLFIHSVESMRRTGEMAGLTLVETGFDSTELQFVGSELYRRGLPLAAGDTYFSRKEFRAFRREAERLNREGRGDSAVFHFRRAEDAGV